MLWNSELEQEIDSFKKENVKISLLKKKLTDEKQRITKEWEEFEKVNSQLKGIVSLSPD